MTLIEELAQSVAQVKLRQLRYDEAGLPEDASIRVKDREIYAERLTALRTALRASPQDVPDADELVSRALLSEAEALTEDEAMAALGAAAILEALDDA